MDLGTIFQHWAPLVLTTVGFIAWGVRLEAKVLFLERDRDEKLKAAVQRETVLWAKLDSLQLALTELVRSVAKLEGTLEHRR